MAIIWPSIISKASRSNSGRRALAAILVAMLLPITARSLVACPFCTALQASLSQRRQRADVVALAEVASTAEGDGPSKFRVHRALKGSKRIGSRDMLAARLDLAVRPGDLVLLFGRVDGANPDGEMTWHAVGVDETSYAYFARSPSPQAPMHERLRYFAQYLEHPDPLVAEDAYLEFGHAPFSDVARMADVLPNANLRNWLVDPRVPQSRKGFYGLAIALAAPDEERSATADFLRGLVIEPADDFRAGFDGILGGYLLLAGPTGLDLIESRYLADPSSADGDVRHALTALRFYHEFGREIPQARLSGAVAQLLVRPEFAEAAITDLARWNGWNMLEQVVKVYARPTSDVRTRRAVVGYLLACPDERAPRALARLRAIDPEGVAAAEDVLSRTSSVGESR
jgi:hypothetical protein